ncbi:hypothetical protein [Hymenobacter radiodurans]|uniref:hypothetical protein n=1 Tax=Hymenobacter radiodurans TaxID=2496028 RepID=UPI0010588130|nr:hypothetical protein [Hymenobacter radiodurans]
MKKLIKSSVVLVALVFSAALMTGCVASAQPGVVVASGPAYYPPPRPYYGYRPRPYYHRPSRVVVVERQPVIVRPYRQRPVVVRPRPGYYRQDGRQPARDGRPYGRDRGRIR